MLAGVEEDLIGSNLSGLADIYLSNQVGEIAAKFDQVRAILDAYPYSNPDKDRLNTRALTLKPELDRIKADVQAGNTVIARLKIEILRNSINTLFNDAVNFQNKQRSAGQEYYKANPSQRLYYNPDTGQGAGSQTPITTTETTRSIGSQLAKKTLGIPNWLWVVGISGFAMSIFGRRR